MSLAALLVFLLIQPQELTVDDGSILAVITHKGGVAKGLAHNHFIYAGKYDLELQASESEPEKMVFELSLPVEKLVVDEYKTAKKYYPRLEATQILDEAFSEQSDKNRAKVKKAMLGKKQLNAKKHATIKASLTGIKAKSTTLGGESFSHELAVTITILGVPVKTELAANLSWQDGAFHLEAIGDVKFSDFGMDPYSAMLGAVSNQDRFHIYVNLVAR